MLSFFYSKGSTNPSPTEKPGEKTKPDEEVTGEGEGAKTGKGGQGGEKKPEPEGEEDKIENIEDFCKTKPDGIYGDPTDCQYFIKCAHSKTYREKCPKGLHWNNKIKNCDYPDKAGCSKQKEKNQNGTKTAQNDTAQEYAKVGVDR